MCKGDKSSESAKSLKCYVSNKKKRGQDIRGIFSNGVGVVVTG